MSLIKSISGIRGTIGGKEADGLNPLTISRFVIAYAEQIRRTSCVAAPLIVVGRDARMSGEMVRRIVTGTLMSVGCHVKDIGLATTPTTEIAVTSLGAQGGIIITASHNPRQWNALKLLGGNGEFLSDAEGKTILALAENSAAFDFAPVDQLGTVREADYLEVHLQKILALPEVDVKAIGKARFRIAFDAINSVGGIALPRLFEKLGIAEIYPLHNAPTGDFAHNPEPLPKHLQELSKLVIKRKADLGISVDPDVDRLALYDETGAPFGEEYTLVAVADYLLDFHGGGNTVSNLSSSRALRDITVDKFGGRYAAAAVGEVNVVAKMKEVSALIGGEGNGGVIFPALHYGRDALVGIALFLTHLAKERCTVSALRKRYPEYYMCKERVELPRPIPFDTLRPVLQELFAGSEVNIEDGIKFDFPEYWIHIRSSNTEPILRIYTEAFSEEEARRVALGAKEKIESLLQD